MFAIDAKVPEQNPIPSRYIISLLRFYSNKKNKYYYHNDDNYYSKN